MDKREISFSDFNVLKVQIPNSSIRVSKVLSRCKFGHPRAVLLNPIREDKQLDLKSIANPLWLTCPYLNKKIHELESKGYIRAIKEFIDSDQEHIKSMLSAHVSYYYLRKSLLKLTFNIPNYVYPHHSILDLGVGGSKNMSHIKCLHQHFGHYLICKENIAGRIVLGLLGGKTDCDRELCKNGINAK